jgi:hypothetical protein
MKIIEAIWDQEVLGKRCVEIQCEVDEPVSSMLPTLMDLNKSHDYIVMKTPVLNRDMVQHASEIGFSFAETLISVERSVSSSSIESRLIRRAHSLETRETDDETAAFVFHQIMTGIFSTDRISLDKHFGPEIGAQRYCNWIKSEVNQGGKIFIVTLPNGSPLGFFTLKVTDEGNAYSVLSGVFDPARTPGFGLILLTLILLKAEENGAKRIFSTISSNNVPVVRTHVQLGFEIKDMKYVFIRHTAKD